MKVKAGPPQSNNRSASNEGVRAEIRAFLEALDSYPQRVAANPHLTFEKHSAQLMALARAAPVPAGASKTREN